MSPLKTLLLHLYYYGGYPMRCRARRRAVAEGRVPVVVLFYHRIADDRATEWTTSHRDFARHVAWLQRHFELISLAETQRRIRCGTNTRAAVSITFDDGYAENCREAMPLLIRKQIPCTYFVTAQNAITGEPFEHDVALGHLSAPNDVAQLRAMADAGVEIGSHAYTHADLGRIRDREELHRHMVLSRELLESRLDRPVRYFAFPFGHYVNLSSAAIEMARDVGYEGVCSAYGGYNFPGDDAFHVQRIHAPDEMIRLRNRATVDPRRTGTPRFVAGRVEVSEPAEACVV